MRAIRAGLAFGLLTLAAACASSPVAPEPVLGGVDLTQPLRLIGTEPFWGVDVTPGGLVYSGVDRPEQRAANPGPRVTDTTATWTATTDRGSALVLTLTGVQCSDGMSDRVYPLTASVRIGAETLSGCAAPTSDIMEPR